VAALAGCVAAPAPQAGTGSEAGGAPSAASTDLVAWHIWSGGRLPLMDDMFARFNEAHPDLNATHEFVSGGSGQLLQKLQTSIAAGDPCDVAMIRHYWVPAFAARKSLLPLDEMAAAHNLDLDNFFEYTLVPSRWDGQLYVLPADGSPFPLMLYNTDHYAEVGLDPQSPPETWDELIETAKALTVMEDGKIVRMGASWGAAYPDIQHLGYLTHSNNGQLISDDARQYFLNSPEAVEALEFVVRLNQEVYGGPEPLIEFTAAQAGLEISDPFQAGTAAQSIAGPWVVALIETGDFELNYDTAPPPHAADGESHAVYMGSWTYGIPTGVPNVEGSWELLEWLTAEPSAGGWFMVEQVRVPALKSVMDDPTYQQYPQWAGIVEQTASAVGTAVTPVMQETVDLVNAVIEAAVVGDMSVQEALDQAQADAQALLDDFYAQQG
jgi:multiple sugar transport system substrate-binding protein